MEKIKVNKHNTDIKKKTAKKNKKEKNKGNIRNI